MHGMYGNKFVDMWRDIDVNLIKSTWANEMGKLSKAELKEGVGKLSTLEWPPTLPQFIKLCRPDVDYLKAYYEAVDGLGRRYLGEPYTWSHPAIYFATTGLYSDLMSKSYSDVRARWESSLKSQLAIGRWDEIPAATKMIENKSTKSSDEIHGIVSEALKDNFVKNDGIVRKAKDHKAWAKKIRDESGKPKHNLSSLQISFAKEALGEAW